MDGRSDQPKAAMFYATAPRVLKLWLALVDEHGMPCPIYLSRT